MAGIVLLSGVLTMIGTINHERFKIGTSQLFHAEERFGLDLDGDSEQVCNIIQ